MPAPPRLAIRASFSWLLFASALVTAPARGQPPDGPPTHVERRAVPLEGGATASLVSTWASTEAESGLSLALGDEPAIALVRGSAPGAIEARGNVALVAFEVGGADRPFRVQLVRRDGARHVLGEVRELARPGARSGDYPFAVAIAPIATGFAVFFQEVQSDDPTAARTYLFQLDGEGAPTAAGREIPVPWPIAAAAWNGSGFHLALYYSGNGDGMRLSMVSLTAEGQPQQHPDWSSAAGAISDVHLVAAEARVRVFYRGGHGGDRLIESDVTTVGSWGSSRREAHDRGALPRDVAICISALGAPVRVPPH